MGSLKRIGIIPREHTNTTAFLVNNFFKSILKLFKYKTYPQQISIPKQNIIAEFRTKYILAPTAICVDGETYAVTRNKSIQKAV